MTKFPTFKTHAEHRTEMSIARLTVSVAMTTLNGAAYIGNQIESILGQSRLPDELVICDDGSTDQTVEILLGFVKSSTVPIIIERNSMQLGSSANFAKAISLCSGDIIALSDQDDVWIPRKLEELARKFETTPETGLIFTNAQIVDENLTSLNRDLWSSVGFNPARRKRFNRGRSDDFLLAHSFITGATMAFRSKFRELVLPIPTAHSHFIHDRWIAVLIAAVADVCGLDRNLILYRQHPNQQIGARSRSFGAQVEGRLSSARDRYAQDLAVLEAIGARLAGTKHFSPRSAFLDALERRTFHLTARAALPGPRVDRFAHVVRELISGRYRRCSGGVLSAVKDLAFSGRPSSGELGN